MRRFKIHQALTTIAAVSTSVTLASCGGGSEQVSGALNAAGASFPAAIYQRWFQELAPEGVAITSRWAPAPASVSSQPEPLISAHPISR